MTFSKGGVVKGEIELKAIFADYPSWRRWVCPPVDWCTNYTGSPIYSGGVIVIYADECLIKTDKICSRTDDKHRRFPPPPYDEMGNKRFWYCPLHDKEDRRGQTEDQGGQEDLSGPSQ